uniref:Uncharacterized protein n=1 Tax=Panagrolaimus sp. ES5 TaxID=591445 RepID=A0AC34F2N8_9BILA
MSSKIASFFVFILLVTIVCQTGVKAAEPKSCTNGRIKCGGSGGGSDCVAACECSGGLEANCNFRDAKCYCS